MPGSLTLALKKEPLTKKINIISYNVEEEEVQITKKKSQHSRDRLKWKSKIYDAIQKGFPTKHGKFYFEHEPDLLTV